MNMILYFNFMDLFMCVIIVHLVLMSFMLTDKTVSCDSNSFGVHDIVVRTAGKWSFVVIAFGHLAGGRRTVII